MADDDRTGDGVALTDAPRDPLTISPLSPGSAPIMQPPPFAVTPLEPRHPRVDELLGKDARDA